MEFLLYVPFYNNDNNNNNNDFDLVLRLGIPIHKVVFQFESPHV